MTVKALNKRNIVRGLYSLYNWVPYYAGVFTPYPVGSFIINVARECEMRCMMCNIWRNRQTDYKGKAVDEEVLSSAIGSSEVLKKMPYIVMTGGEPFLRNDFKDMLTALFQFPHVLKITIGTSAFLKNKILSDVEHVLEHSPANKQIALQVSLQGVGEVQDRIKGKENCFIKVQETIAELKDLQKKYPGRLILYIYSVLQPENKDTFEKTYEFAQSNDIGYSFGIVNNMFYNNNSGDSYTKESITINDVRRLSRAYSKYAILENWTKNNFTQGALKIRCFAGYSSLFIDYDGSVFPCLPVCKDAAFRMGNIFDDPFDKIWTGKRSDTSRQLTKSCNIDECLMGCDRAVVKFQYFLPDLLSRIITLNQFSYLKSKSL